LCKVCSFWKQASIKKTFDFVFTIEQAFQTKFQGVRGFDFLLDGRGINKENTLFLIGRFAKREWINEQIAKAFYVLRFADLFRLGHLCRSEHNALFGFSNALSLIRVLLFKPDSRICFLRAFLKSLVVYIKYSVLIESFSFKAYIYTNNESSSQIAINIFLRKKNISSWCYLMFLVGGYPRSASEQDFIEHRNVLWSFINPDYMIGMNDNVISYFRLHHQGVRNYHTVGSLYSEMVVVNNQLIDRDHFLRGCFPGISVENTKVCAFFDTTFVAEEEAFASFDDGFAFYTDIAKVLNEKILVIIKPSKGDAFYVAPNGQWSSLEKGEKVVGAMDLLRSHPRVYFAGDAGDIPSIMAVSDVVVTHCMSSTTAEALGARKKAIWYESGTKHKGLLYDHIPGLVIHGYQELKDRLDFLFNSTSNDCYDEYLNHYIKGKVESHLDGKALTRFRDMLVNRA
jgi:polysaccharide biosynthesis PFTS motif protein